MGGFLLRHRRPELAVVDVPAAGILNIEARRKNGGSLLMMSEGEPEVRRTFRRVTTEPSMQLRDPEAQTRERPSE